MPDPAMVSLVLTACWMLVAYLQRQRARYLALSASTACLGFATKLPGLVALVPMIYAACVLSRPIRNRHLILARLGAVATLSLLPIAGYYLWALHLGRTYPPYHIAGAGNFVWDNGLIDLRQHNFYLPELCWNARWMWDWPTFARHIEQTCTLYRKSPEWVIYKMEPQPVVSASPGVPASGSVARS